MDIEYLLLLQDFRNATQDILTPLMHFFSLFGILISFVFPLFIYWMVDKKKGLYPLLAYHIAITAANLIKLTACVYRPWVRDSRIRPAGNAVHTADGYSFPSGHTTTACTILGGSALVVRKDEKKGPLFVLLITAALLTGFSRNYLGVHTPQDVLAGLLLGALVLYAAARLMAYLERHPEKEGLFLLAGLLGGIASLVYIAVKPYPPVPGGQTIGELMKSAFDDIGRLIGFTAGRYIEKKWVRFTPSGFAWRKLPLCIAGLIPIGLLYGLIHLLSARLLPAVTGKLCFGILFTLYYMAAFPALLKIIDRRNPSALR